MKKKLLMILFSAFVIMPVSPLKASLLNEEGQGQELELISTLSSGRDSYRAVLDNQGESDEKKAKAKFFLTLMDMKGIGIAAPLYSEARTTFQFLLEEGLLSEDLTAQTYLFLGTMAHLGQGLEAPNYTSARNYYGLALEFPSLADPFKSQAYYALGKMDYRG